MKNTKAFNMECNRKKACGLYVNSIVWLHKMLGEIWQILGIQLIDFPQKKQYVWALNHFSLLKKWTFEMFYLVFQKYL